jgi:hypothetical protein
MRELADGAVMAKEHPFIDNVSDWSIKLLRANGGAGAALVFGLLLLGSSTNWGRIVRDPWPIARHIGRTGLVSLPFISVGLVGVATALLPYRGIRYLHKLHKKGILTSREYKDEKTNLLCRSRRGVGEQVKAFLEWADRQEPKPERLDEVRRMLEEWAGGD